MTYTMEIPEILIRAEIFSDLSPDELALIASISTVREFRAEEIIFEENSTGNELYVVADGEVDIRVDPTRVGERAGCLLGKDRTWKLSGCGLR